MINSTRKLKQTECQAAGLIKAEVEAEERIRDEASLGEGSKERSGYDQVRSCDICRHCEWAHQSQGNV
jgi:hypothetical protein